MYYIRHSTHKPPPYRDNTQRQQLSWVVLVYYSTLPLEVCRVVPQPQGLGQRPEFPIECKTLPQVAWIIVRFPHKWRHLDDAGTHEAVGDRRDIPRAEGEQPHSSTLCKRLYIVYSSTTHKHDSGTTHKHHNSHLGTGSARGLRKRGDRQRREDYKQASHSDSSTKHKYHNSHRGTGRARGLAATAPLQTSITQ